MSGPSEHSPRVPHLNDASILSRMQLPRAKLDPIVQIKIGDQVCTVDHRLIRDISIGPEVDSALAVSAFNFPPLQKNDVISVSSGHRCNCYAYNNWAPHLQGTHIETRSHITLDAVPVVQRLKDFALLARLVTVPPTTARGLNLSLVDDPADQVITKDAVLAALSSDSILPQALILRTPNFPGKQHHKYGSTNPAYPHHEVAAWAVEAGIEHIVLDLPSADREIGELFFHRTFWQDPIDAHGKIIPELAHVPNNPRDSSTITELSFIPQGAQDGWYVLYLSPISLPGDAAPVRPMIAPILDLK